MARSSYAHHTTGSLYGAFAHACVILTCFAGYFYTQNYHGSEWRVLVSFGLGAIHTVVGVLCLNEESGSRAKAGYFIFQCALLTALLWLSPIRGFFGIIVLPVASEAIFNLKWPWALAVGAYLYALNISLWGIPYGWGAAQESFLNYAAAYAFTAGFTVITKRALEARNREEKLRRELEAANQQLRDYAAQAEDLATTRERNRVAREIHDGVGHYLTVVKTQLDAAAALMPSQPARALETVTKAAKLAGDALDDVRRSVGALRTDETRPPLPEALRALAREAGLPATVRVEGAARPLPPGIEHALYRAAQEALTNIRKHAAASAAEMVLDFRSASRVQLVVTDNGKGLAAGGPTGGGFGLLGIRERIEVIGGRVESGNRRDGGGFALTIEVPA